MPRSQKCRKISFRPVFLIFKPAGAPARELEEIVLALDEMEAVRLADLEGLYQEEAARRMNVSRQTFANILASGRRKIAQAIVWGKALRIEGGNIEMKEDRFVCRCCLHAWSAPLGACRPVHCPRCEAEDVRPAPGEGETDSRRNRECRHKRGLLPKEDARG